MSDPTNPKPIIPVTEEALHEVKPDANGMINMAEVAKISATGLGYQRVWAVQGSTYKDSSTVVIIPSREKFVHHKVWQSWKNMIAPMNQKKAEFFIVGDEVGHAYTNCLKQILANPELSKWKYVMTLETDNVIPPDAHIRLLESITAGNFDGVSGLYFTKGMMNQPMAYGDAAKYKATGVLDFAPLDIREALSKGQIVEVNGIAMGCSLYKMELFKQIEPPWFVTVNDVVNGAVSGFTQDLWFCKKAKEMGKSFAVDMRVLVGHLDLQTDEMY